MLPDLPTMFWKRLPPLFLPTWGGGQLAKKEFPTLIIPDSHNNINNTRSTIIPEGHQKNTKNKNKNNKQPKELEFCVCYCKIFFFRTFECDSLGVVHTCAHMRCVLVAHLFHASQTTRWGLLRPAPVWPNLLQFHPKILPPESRPGLGEGNCIPMISVHLCFLDEKDIQKFPILAVVAIACSSS